MRGLKTMSDWVLIGTALEAVMAKRRAERKAQKNMIRLSRGKGEFVIRGGFLGSSSGEN